ncbi:response regulator [Helicovermis profundi]|uniref:Stage 0 sporulation protein A homolog n=1 Tax=Helicovermis profundi TaxID=3065157 RepID=A0AAU9E951_9FIRM|nr:response regulator transcription factor [Clostridia bacterium S502]
MSKILIVDDEKHIVELLSYNLQNEGHEVLVAYDGEEAIEVINKNIPDLVLLDLMLPKISGIDVCKKVRSNEKTMDISIIMITAKSEEIDKVIGLEIGADDYITKPFSVRELLARIKALLRRVNRKVVENKENVYSGYGIELDIDKHTVFMNGEKIDLTFKEFELLKILFENKGKVLTRDHLLDKLWGYDYYGDTRTVDVHIRHLRKKLGENKGSEIIETVRGLGYKIS